MSDRQAFMRQMGITDDDMKIKEDQPPLPSSTSTRGSALNDSSAGPSSDRRIKFASHAEYMDRPKPKMNSSDVAAAAPPPSNAQSRSDFLRSLGIDNADLPTNLTPPVDASTSTPHASKEYLKKAVMSSNEEPPQRREIPAARPDLTLGQRRSSRLPSEPSAVASPAVPSQSAPPLPSADDNMTTEQLRVAGNDAFEGGDFRRAIRLYSKAIERDPTNAALYSNRSAAYLQGSKQMGMDTRTKALRDADRAIELRPTWFKGYSRKGDALFKLEAFAEAAAAYEKGLEFDEGNMNLMQSLQGAKRAAAGVPRKERSVISIANEEAERERDQRTVFDMVDELRETQRKMNSSSTTGYDYRAQELERFRMGKDSTKSATGSVSSTGMASYSSDDAPSNPQPQQREGGSTTAAPSAGAPRGSIPTEFSSSAAAAYQNELLERYRRKKGMQSK